MLFHLYENVNGLPVDRGTIESTDIQTAREHVTTAEDFFVTIQPLDSKQEPEFGVCACQQCGGEAQGSHTCPYKEEIHDDYETECNCCDNCRQSCCDDI